MSINSLLSKNFDYDDAYFGGQREVAFTNTDGPEITGAIRIAAKIKINSVDDVINGFHCIVSHNKRDGDNTYPENFLRIRGRGSEPTIHFECGSWVNQINYLVQANFNKSEHVGKEIYVRESTTGRLGRFILMEC
ncbi:MAG: hypothetical protein LBC74_08640 [Planctomycetaceae bacterium]|nr:hypothetical protein [Planctomycetaceae bacterium]